MMFVNLRGVTDRARRFVSRAASIHDDDVKEPSRLADILRKVSGRVSDLEARTPPSATEFEVDLTTGSPVRLEHGFKGPVRWYVTSWKTSQTGTQTPTITVSEKTMDDPWQLNSHVVYRATAYTWNPVVSTNAQGTRYRMKRVRPIIGIRFVWQSAGGARNITCDLWRDDTGAKLATAVVSVNNSGIYNAIFSTPIETDLTGTDITVSCWGTNFTTVNSTIWKTTSIELDENLTLKHMALTGLAGTNERPTITHGSAVTVCIEPIIGKEETFAASSSALDSPRGPELSVDNDASSDKILVLNSYSTGRAVIRVEPAQAGLTYG